MGTRRIRATDVEVDTKTGPGSTGTWNPKPETETVSWNHGIMETETEYGIRERRFQVIDLKEKILAMTMK